MKKLLLLPITAMLFISCEEAPKNEIEAQENIAAEFESGRVYTALDFNEGLMAESNILDVKLAMLEDLDFKNVPTAEMDSACESAIEEYKRVMQGLTSIEPYGEKGAEFKKVVIVYAKVLGGIFNMYDSYSDLLEIPDEEWTEENANLWQDEYIVLSENYDVANNNFIEVQKEYARLNNLNLDYGRATPEEMYQESIASE